MKYSSILAACAMVATLSGCGGGGSDPFGPDQQPQGFWQGTATDGRVAWGLVQANGEAFLIISAKNGQPALELVHRGRYTEVNGYRVIASDARLIALAGFPFSTSGVGAHAGDFKTRSTWIGNIDGDRYAYQLSYVNDGVQASSLAQMAGTYDSWAVAAATSGSVSTMTINASGNISGTYFSGCTYTGQASPTAQANVYEASLSFTGTCYMSNPAQVKTLLFHDAANTRVYAAAVMVAKGTTGSEVSASFMFVGPRR